MRIGKNKDLTKHLLEAKESNRVYLDNMPKADILAMIDETNNPGSRTDGDNYIFGATVIDAVDLETYNDITEKRYNGFGLKFRKNPDMRGDVLKEMAELDIRIYSVIVKIPPDEHCWNKKEQRDAHRDALRTIIVNISANEKAESIHVIVDRNNKAKAGKVNEFVNDAVTISGKKITADIRISDETFPLQTNDFIVGALGQRYNHNDGGFICGFHVNETVLEFGRKETNDQNKG